jgi:hypothetical protein
MATMSWISTVFLKNLNPSYAADAVSSSTKVALVLLSFLDIALTETGKTGSGGLAALRTLRAVDWRAVVPMMGAYVVVHSLRSLRLGLLLKTTDITASPRINAIVCKYQPMVMDRERWVLPIVVADNQEMRDGTVNVQTMAQQLTHLKSLVNSVAPIVYTDVDGLEYNVKVTGAGRRVLEFDQVLDGTRKIGWIFTLAVEEM